MGRPRNETVGRITRAIERIFDALEQEPDYTITTKERRNTSCPYREIRVDSQILYDECGSKAQKRGIEKVIKWFVADDTIGVYAKEFIPNNKVLASNNVTKPGLMIHCPLTESVQ